MFAYSGVPRSTYYYNRKLLKAKPEDPVRKRISEVFHNSKGRYGVRRVTQVLHNEGLVVNHKRVHKLMREMGLHGNVPKRKHRSYKGDVGKKAPNIVARDFKPAEPLETCGTDVTEFKLKFGDMVYLSPVKDFCTGEILFYTTSDSPNLNMVTTMLDKLYEKHPYLEGMILHSDQG